MTSHLNNVNEKSIREEVGKAISNGSCILLVGFGSIQVCASDGELLYRMFQWCVQEGLIDEEETKTDFEESFKRGSLDKAALKIEEYLTEKSQQQECLKKVLSHIHRLLAQIPFSAYLTTTCDTSIENAYSQVRAPNALTKFYKTSIESAIKEHQKDKPFILKLHDDVDEDNSDSTILHNRTIKSTSRNTTTFRSSLRMLLSDAHTLFIGFEKADSDLEDLKGLISKKETLKSWMVVPKGYLSLAEATKLWENEKISAVEYATQYDLIDFLKKIEELSSTPREIEIYISYAHEDKKMQDELRKHLEVMSMYCSKPKISLRDGVIGAGEEPEPEIERRLNTAEVVLLLVSVDYLISLKERSNIETEVTKAVERHNTGVARVIPVILQPCSWEHSPFANLQVLPMNKTPIALLTGPKRTKKYVEVVEHIEKAIKEWTKKH